VSLDKAGFAGVVAAEGLVQGATIFDENKGRKLFSAEDFPDWPSIIRHWKMSITNTAKALQIGDARVQFDNEKQLNYCEVLPLLRLAERQLQFEHQQSKGLA
jgi:exodeoxyribonuclease-5